jgi:hypothetical protein
MSSIIDSSSMDLKLSEMKANYDKIIFQRQEEIENLKSKLEATQKQNNSEEINEVLFFNVTSIKEGKGLIFTLCCNYI